jgi:molybdopterin molybdotransferase
MPHGSCPWAKARDLAATAAVPVTPRRVPLAAAAGAVLATDALALSDLPQADTSAMDGWAVAGPPAWRVTGSLPAGTPPIGPLATGTAVEIATGAVVPDGADGVLRSERGVLEGLLLRPALGIPVEGLPEILRAEVRRTGRECREGEIVLPAGARLGPAAIGLLAAAGHDAVDVRVPAADLLVLGDELLTSGRARDGRLRDALGPMLSAWLPALGAALASRCHVPDRADALALALRACRGDVVVTTGSTARGPVDHLHTVLAEAGADLVVDGVAVRPGHPQVLALLPDGRPLVGLPGNPLAAVSGLLTLFGPLVTTLAGATSAPRRTGRLRQDVPAGAEATRLVPLSGGTPVMFAGPAMLRGLAGADAVAVVPPGGLRAGDEVELLDLP